MGAPIIGEVAESAIRKELRAVQESLRDLQERDRVQPGTADPLMGIDQLAEVRANQVRLWTAFNDLMNELSGKRSAE